MRILTVGNMYPPHHQGGYEQDWRAGVEALRRADHHVRVLTTDHRQPGVAVGEEPDVFRVLRWYWRDHAFPAMPVRERLRLGRHNQRLLRCHLSSLDPDLVSWWAMGGMSLGLVERVRRRAIPAVGVVYDDWQVYGPGVDAWQRMWRRVPSAAARFGELTGAPTRVDLARAADWLFCSDSVRQSAAGSRAVSPSEQLLAPGLDEVFLSRWQTGDWRWRMLLAGRLDPRKGIETAIEALTLLPHAVLRLIGTGDAAYRCQLLAMAERLGVAERLELFPARAREQLVEAYAWSDVVLFPVTWREPFGLVPLEAMGIGRPVVATGQGGSAEYLRDGDNCLLMAPGGAGALAACVERLAESRDLRERLCAGGFRTVPPYARSRWDAQLVGAHERRHRQRAD